MSGLEHPGHRRRRRRDVVVRRGRRRRHRLRHRGRLRSGQRRGGRSAGAGAGEGRRGRRYHRRWPAGISTSAAAPPCSRPPATTTPPRRCTSTSSRCRASPTSTRSAPTATAASSTSIGLRRLAFSSSAVIGGQGGGSAGHRGAVLHRQREGVAVLRAGRTRAARSFCAGARGTRRRRHGHRPAAQASRRSGRPDPLRDRRHQPHCRRRRRGRSELEALH